MNASRFHMAHPRLDSARWPEPLTAPGAAQACPSCLPSPANQRTRQDDPHPGRPLKQGPRFAPYHASIGGFTGCQPAFFPFRTPAMDALIGSRLSGSLGLRPLAPLPLTAASNQRNFTDSLGFARPFLPSSPSPKPRLRAERIGGVTSFDPSNGVPGNKFRDSFNDLARLSGPSTFAVVFPVPDDRQDSTFSRKKCGRAAGAHFPAAPARVRHASEGVTFFQNTPQVTP